jgi:hypothetical protein
MLRSVGSMQGVDLLRADRKASLMSRLARLSTVLVCGVAVLLTVGVAAASAEPRFTEYFKPFTQTFTLCEGHSSETCHEEVYKFPAGTYEEDTALSNDAYEQIREEEKCANPEKYEGCAEEIRTKVSRSNLGLGRCLANHKLCSLDPTGLPILPSFFSTTSGLISRRQPNSLAKKMKMSRNANIV